MNVGKSKSVKENGSFRTQLLRAGHALGRQNHTEGLAEATTGVITLLQTAHHHPGVLMDDPEKPSLVINNHGGIEMWLQNGIADATELMEHPKGANALVLKMCMQDAACS